MANAVSRAYYTMFYAAQALLHAKALTAKSHAGTISLFGKEIAEKGLVPRELGRTLRRAFNMRQKGDYDAEAEFEWEEVDGLIKQAKMFVEATRRALSPTNRGK